MKKLLIYLFFILFVLTSCEQVHNHRFNENFEYNLENHWQECSCSEIKELHSHTFSEGKVTLEATKETEGKETFTCSVCGYEKIKTIQKLPKDPLPITPVGDGFIIYSLEMKGTYGDSNLIKYGDYEILVDGGTSSDATTVKKTLETYCTDGVLDLLIISHQDADHMDGVSTLSTFESISSITEIIQNGDSRGGNAFKMIIVPYFGKAINSSIVDLIEDPEYNYIDVDDEFSIHFLRQDNYFSDTASKNNKSICFTINYKNTIVFMGGDAEENACNSVMANNPNLTTEDNFVIFKILHHASKGTNKDNFIKYLKPDLCFVTTGMKLSAPNNTPSFSNHPYIDCLKIIAKYTKQIYWSGINGNIIIKCDGYTASVTGIGRTRNYYYTDKTTKGYHLASIEDEKNCTFFESRWYGEAINYLGAPNYANITL